MVEIAVAPPQPSVLEQVKDVSKATKALAVIAKDKTSDSTHTAVSKPFVILHARRLSKEGVEESKWARYRRLAAALIFYKVAGPAVPNPFLKYVDDPEPQITMTAEEREELGAQALAKSTRDQAAGLQTSTMAQELMPDRPQSVTGYLASRGETFEDYSKYMRKQREAKQPLARVITFPVAERPLPEPIERPMALRSAAR